MLETKANLQWLYTKPILLLWFERSLYRAWLMTTYLSISLFICLSIYLSIYPSISLYLSIYLSIYLSVYLSTYIYIYIYIFVYIFISLYIYTYIYIYIFQGLDLYAVSWSSHNRCTFPSVTVAKVSLTWSIENIEIYVKVLRSASKWKL